MNSGTILIVDDIPADLRLIAGILAEHGYIVRPTKSGAAAIASVKAEAPDLILLDLSMPDMSGHEVCECLKQDERLCDIPIIFLSSSHDAEDKVRALSVGAVDFISKPYESEEVIARVQTHLTISALQQQLRQHIARFQTLAEATFEAVFLFQKGCIADVNRLAEKISGYQHDELIGKEITELIAPGAHDRLLYARRSGDEGAYETTLFRKNGTSLPVDIRTKTLKSHEHELMVCAMRDLSAHKRLKAEKDQLQHENIALKTGIRDRYRFGDVIGKSRPMQALYELIAKAAASDVTVLIGGESGTGKELVARTIHDKSERRQKAFVAVNCGAISETLFEREFFGHCKGAFTGADRNAPGYFDAADGSTLFLDEVGELSESLQASLLRAIDRREYTPVGATTPKTSDVRIIAATNKNLEELVRQGCFREDFFYRLHVLSIEIPPLHERKEDIPLLIEYLLEQQYRLNGRSPRLPVRVVEQLTNYDWPGNVRELQNELQRYLTTGQLTLKDIRRHEKAADKPSQPENLQCEHLTLYEAADAFEKQVLLNALNLHRWHKGRAAEQLGIDRKTLYKKLKKHRIL